MKKILILVLLLATQLMCSAQTPLFKGIKSGMNKTEVMNYLKSNSEFEFIPEIETVSAFKTSILLREYAIIPTFNKKNLLQGIIILSTEKCKWYEFNSKLKEIATELFTLLKNRYGEPVYNKYPNYESVSEDVSVLVCKFKKDNVIVEMDIDMIDDDGYIIVLYLADVKYLDEDVMYGGF